MGNEGYGFHLNRLCLMALAFIATACSGGGGSSGSSDQRATATTPSATSPAETTPSASTYTIGGSIGDGPIVNADIVVRDASGVVVATGVSDAYANYSLEIPTATPRPVTLHVTGGIDLVTDRGADFELVAILNATGAQTVNISPLTTLAVKAAQCRGDTTEAGLNEVWDDVSRDLSIGLDGQQLGDPMTQMIDRYNIETAVLANEAIGELVRRSGAGMGGAVSLDDIVDVLACDLADGVLDGAVVGNTALDEQRIYAVAKAAELSIRLEVLAGALEVDGVDASAAMNSAIRTIMPTVTDADVNTVPITDTAIESAIAVIDDLSGLLQDPELSVLRAALSDATPDRVRGLVDEALNSAVLTTLQGMPSRVASMDPSEIDQVGVSSADRVSDTGADSTDLGSTSDIASETESGSEGVGTDADADAAVEPNAEAAVGESDSSAVATGTGSTSDVESGTESESQAGADPVEESNSDGTVSTSPDTEPVNVPAPVVQLNVSDINPLQGSSVTLSWSSSDAAVCEASGGWSGEVSLNGQQTLGPVSAAATYTLTCTNSTGSDIAMVSIVPVGSLTLNWQAPSENVDGSPVSGINGYNIHYGAVSGQYDEVAGASGTATSHTFQLPVGNYYFSMTAIDTEGDESGLSNEVMLTVQ